jgi:hypothetical protein
MTYTLPAQIPDDLIELVEHRWDKKSRRKEGKMAVGRGNRSWGSSRSSWRRGSLSNPTTQ